MNEIAEPAPDAPFAAVEPAARFSEVGDGRELAVDGAGGVPAGVEGVAGLLGGVFVFEARVDVADEICLVEEASVDFSLGSKIGSNDCDKRAEEKGKGMKEQVNK